MSQNKKKTSNSVAKIASKILKHPNSSKTAKELAGSALSHVSKKNQTGESDASTNSEN